MDPIGVAALQGDFDSHCRVLSAMDVPSRLVRNPRDLEGICGLILPGGETSTQILLARDTGLLDAMERFRVSKRPIFGTCAGAILLARTVTKPSQFSLGMIEMEIERNAYGRQQESFEILLDTPLVTMGRGVLKAGCRKTIFIRAPRITHCGEDVSVLLKHHGSAILVQQEQVLAATFHPEIGGEPWIHQYFVDMALRASQCSIKGS